VREDRTGRSSLSRDVSRIEYHLSPDCEGKRILCPDRGCGVRWFDAVYVRGELRLDIICRSCHKPFSVFFYDSKESFSGGKSTKPQYGVDNPDDIR
jgi:hypothetical protein